MASIKSNVVLNVVNTVVGLLFPLITFPYVSRILLPEGIGLIQFYQSIINYIVLLSAIGIPLYAVREIAKLRDDVAARNKATVEILTLHAILSIIGYLVVFILIATITKIHSDWPLFLILSFSIFFNVIGVSWFYQAVEDFKYITLRSLIVRICSLFALFIFVKSRADLYAYAIILIGGQVGNYLFNFIRLRKYSVFSKLKEYNLNLKPHLLASSKIFVLNIAISLYVNINPIMLGFMTEDVYVGYYTSVTRIITAINGLTTAIGMAILPRLSNYYASGRLEEYRFLKIKAINLICFLCIPISIGLILVAPNLIPIFSGYAYLPAIRTLQISAPTLFISAVNTIIAIQILYTQNQEKIVIIATIIGGCVNIILNILLIPFFKQNGTAVSGLFAELTVLIVCLVLGSHYINYNFCNANNKQIVLASFIFGVICWMLSHISDSSYVILPIQILSSIIVYFTVLLLCRNTICSEYLLKLPKKIKLLKTHK